MRRAPAMAGAAWLWLAGQALAQAPSGLIGFHAPWDAASAASLKAHAAQLSVVAPAWISVAGPDHAVTVDPDPAGRAALAHRGPRLWIMAQNARLGAWDGAGAATLMRAPAATSALLDRLERELVQDKADGLVVDFEDLPAAALPDLRRFLDAARQRCRRHGWTLGVTAPVGNPDWDLAALAQAADTVVLMAYDEHWQTGAPGPIASNAWFHDKVAQALAAMPKGKAAVAVASYAYDWPKNGAATPLSVADAQALAARQGAPLQVDASGNSRFVYTAVGVRHEVWFVGAEAARRQMRTAATLGAAHVALWRLGSEDPALWSQP